MLVPIKAWLILWALALAFVFLFIQPVLLHTSSTDQKSQNDPNNHKDRMETVHQEGQQAQTVNVLPVYIYDIPYASLFGADFNDALQHLLRMHADGGDGNSTTSSVDFSESFLATLSRRDIMGGGGGSGGWSRRVVA